MMQGKLGERFLLAALLVAILLLGARADDPACEEAKTLIFNRNQEQLLAQVTYLKLTWIKHRCYDETIKWKAEIGELIDTAELDSDTSCSPVALEKRVAVQSKYDSRTNAGIFVREYNQFQYEACRASQTRKLNNMAESLTPNELRFSAKVIGITKQVKNSLRALRQELNADDIRLKAAFLLTKHEAKMGFMDDPRLPLEGKSKRLYVNFYSSVVSKCEPILAAIKPDAVWLTKLYELSNKPPISSSVTWVEMVRFCEHSVAMADENLNENWFRLRPRSLANAVNVEDMRLPDDPLESASLSSSTMEAITQDILSRDRHAERMLAYERRLDNRHKVSGEPMKPEKTFQVVNDLCMFYENWRMPYKLKRMESLRSVAIVNLGNCLPKKLFQRRAHQNEFSENDHLLLFVDFYAQLQARLCIDEHQAEMKWKVADIFHNPTIKADFTPFIRMSYRLKTFGVVKSNIDYRVFALLAYIIQSRDPSASYIDSKEIFTSFSDHVRKPCRGLASIVRPHIMTLTAVLSISSEITRPHLLNNDSKFTLVTVKACRYLEENLYPGIDYRDMYRQNKEQLNLRPSSEDRSSDITDLELYYQPNLAFPPPLRYQNRPRPVKRDQEASSSSGKRRKEID